MQFKAKSSFCQQYIATFKRRIRQWRNNKKEFIASMNPFILPLIYIIIILVVIREIDMPEVKNAVFKYAFPFLVLFGIMTSCGIFSITPTIDRELKLRHLLMFAGMWSTSYYFGLLLADFIIFMLPQYILIIFIFVL